EGFADVLRALRAEGTRAVVLGAPAERPLAEEVVRLAGGAATVLAGQTDLATLVAVIDRLAVLVANDSAPMHVARAGGVPVVAVFCATTPSLGYGPWGERTRVVEVDLACRPCARHGGPRCPRGTDDCQRLVRPESVLAAARALLASPRTAGSAARAGPRFPGWRAWGGRERGRPAPARSHPAPVAPRGGRWAPA